MNQTKKVDTKYKSYNHKFRGYLNSRFSIFKKITLSHFIEGFIILLIVVGFSVVGVAVMSGKWQIRPILSGSMEPGFSVGGVVVTETVPTSSLKVGDVAVFYPPFEHTASYVHRIVTLSRKDGVSTITTKGDANLTTDPWIVTLKGKSAYLARFTLPLLGYAAVWVHSPEGRYYLVVIGLILLFVLIGVTIHEEKNKRLKKRSRHN